VLVLTLKILAGLHELIEELLDFFSMEKRIELEGASCCPGDHVEEVHEKLTVENVHTTSCLAKWNTHKTVFTHK
jgi:hypothetical protein